MKKQIKDKKINKTRKQNNFQAWSCSFGLVLMPKPVKDVTKAKRSKQTNKQKLQAKDVTKTKQNKTTKQ